MVALSRRAFLTGGAAAAAVAVSGCTAGDGGDPTAAERRVIEYLDADPAADNFDGNFADLTGMNGGPEEADAIVDVGATGNGGNFAFDAPAITVTAGTTISWRWTGDGGDHNVVSTEASDFDFDSGAPTGSGQFERTFDAAGVGLYRCEPHESAGMKGGFVVVE